MHACMQKEFNYLPSQVVFLEYASICVPTDKLLYIASGFEGDIEDTVWCASSSCPPLTQPRYTSNAEETDTRLWLHIKNTQKERILVKSPNRHLSYRTPLHHDQRRTIIIQINKYNSNKLQYICLQALITALENAPDLSALPKQQLPQILQQCTQPQDVIVLHFSVE